MKWKPYTMMAKVYGQVKSMDVGDSITADKNYYPDGTVQNWIKYRSCLSKVAASMGTVYWTRLDGDSLTVRRLE